MAVDSNIALRVSCAMAMDRARQVAIGSVLYANNLLNSVAQAFADDMATKGYFNHRDQSGRWPWDRLSLAGYRWAEAGEDIAWGQTTGEEVVADWKNSPGHWAQIVHPGYTQFGVGCAAGKDGRLFWVLDFCRPAGPVSRALAVPIPAIRRGVTYLPAGTRLGWVAATAN